jgi:chitodextrinase
VRFQHYFAKAGMPALITLVLTLLALAGSIGAAKQAAAACAPPTPSLGMATGSITVPATAKYRIWSRIMAPSTTSNSYLLEVDGNQCFTVGGKTLPLNAWTWVDYQKGNGNAKVELTLTKGTHKVVFYGKQPDVRLDRIMTTSDMRCQPSGGGDNCNAPADSTPPKVSLTSPSENAVVGRSVRFEAAVSDNVAVKKVEFYAATRLLSTDTVAPYAVQWDSTESVNGSQMLTVKAYDASNNMSMDTHQVIVRNEDMEAPRPATGLAAVANAYNAVTLSWQPATDGVGVVGYTILRNGAPLKKIGAGTTYSDGTVLPNTTYAYQLIAFDAAGNTSPSSMVVRVKTPTVADPQAPSGIAGLRIVPDGDTQVNLSWQPSTDNVGVATYEVYRKTSRTPYSKLTDVSLPSLGDANVTANTSYRYYIVARDSAGNRSPASDPVSVTTPAPTSANKNNMLRGTVFSSKSSRPTVAHVEILVNGTKRTYTTSRKGEYVIRGLEAGSYNVTYGKPSYYSHTLTARVPSIVTVKDVTLRAK